MARQYRTNLAQAIRDDIFYVVCCGGCGREHGKLYFVCQGMYAGMLLCRSCAIEHMNTEEEE